MLVFLGIACVSAAGLAFEITLTRLFAVAQGYHFGFLAVSLALLGFGASGTALAVRRFQSRDAAFLSRSLARLALLFSFSLIGSYLAVNFLPFDSYRIAWEGVQLVYLVLYYLALVAPFFLGGLVLGLPLAAMPAQTTRVYAANLVGSGLGCLAGLGALAVFDGPGAVFFAALLAGFGALAFSLGHRQGGARFWRRSDLPHDRESYAALAMTIGWSVLLIAAPPIFALQVSPYKSLSQTLRLPDARLVSRSWNAFSRVEVIESSSVRSAPGLSLTYTQAMPPQRALFEDAESLSPLTDAAPADLIDALPVTLAYRLRPDARALIIKPGGGIQVLTALNGRAREITAVEDNPLIARAEQQFAPNVFGDPRVSLVSEATRTFLARSPDRFDLIHLALSDSFRPVTAGAYTLGENYIYTQEAFKEYVAHLSDDGILAVSRWLQLPPTEEVRVAALAVAALDGAPRERILALRSFSTLLLLVKRSPFTAREIEMAKAFAEERQFDWVAYPAIRADEANRFSVLREDVYFAAFQQLLDRDRGAHFLATYAYDVTPPTDDRPFFFHFFRWEQTPQTLQLLGKLWQPFGGSGYLILVALLVISVLVSGGLILLPLMGKREKRNPGELTRLIYFACLGIGFLFVEIPLIQRFVLFLDRPVYAFAVVLFTLLLASGIGSAVSTLLPLRAALALLAIVILTYPLVLPFVFQAFLASAFVGRVLVSVVLLAPMGFLMGIPFPQGLVRLGAQAPGLVPLAWGINGCASVISSILATMGAMTWGFSAVLLAGAAMYGLAALICPASEGRTAHP